MAFNRPNLLVAHLSSAAAPEPDAIGLNRFVTRFAIFRLKLHDLCGSSVPIRARQADTMKYARLLFAADLHGSVVRYEQLFERIVHERPTGVFLGGDLLPGGLQMMQSFDPMHEDFLNGFLATKLEDIRAKLGSEYPAIFVIFGNDDPRHEEAALIDIAMRGLLIYAHEQRHPFGAYQVYGYSRIPPSPFQLKDWERYDVSRYVDPGCVAPSEGVLTVPIREYELLHGTIKRDLETLVGADDLTRAIMLFHAPPYQTNLDRAALDGQMIDHVPLDVHVGSIAIRRLLEKRQPRVALHGHIHESARLTGSWRDMLGATYCLSAAHDGPELALVRFDPDDPAAATRELI